MVNVTSAGSARAPHRCCEVRFNLGSEVDGIGQGDLGRIVGTAQDRY
jgi:hypothetical protein